MLKVYKSSTVELSDESFTLGAHKSVDEDYILTDIGLDGAADMDTSDPADREMAEMFRKAEEQAEELLRNATESAAQQAEQILQSARQQAATESEMLRKRTYEEAYNQGLADGIQAKARQIEALISKLEQSVVHIEGELSGFIAQYEGDLKWAVLEVASKVLDRIVERDDLAILEMVKTAVDTVKNSEWIDVHLSDEAVYLIDRLEREMSPMKYLTIVPDELPPGSCIVDIPSGRVDASIHTQLNNLKEYFANHNDNGL